jgi:hypothetical protein
MDENIFRLPCYHFLMAQQPLVSHGQFNVEASWSHSDAPHLVRFLCMSDQTDADIYLTAHNTHKRQTFMALAGFKPPQFNKWAATEEQWCSKYESSDNHCNPSSKHRNLSCSEGDIDSALHHKMQCNFMEYLWRVKRVLMCAKCGETTVFCKN